MSKLMSSSPTNETIAAAPAVKSGPPRSATHFGLNLVALACVLITMHVLRQRHDRIDNGVVQNAVLALCVATAVPLIVLDLLVLRVHRRASTGIDWDKARDFDLGRILTKLVGLGFTLGIIALAYFVSNEYHGDFYNPFYNMLRRFWPALVTGAVAYVAIVDGQMPEPRDAYWQLGRVVLGRSSDASASVMANHFKGWLVKAFFFPLMLVWLHGNVRDVLAYDFSTFAWTNARLYHLLNTFLYLLDLLFCVVGYAMSFRVIDSHLRTAEPTILGWVVALECYPPFYSLISAQYLHYGGAPEFDTVFAQNSTARWIWAFVILALVAIYVSATIVFGVRFSNLTHRGILTNGPYRFTKHPAYVSKNLSWWLVSLPFLPTAMNAAGWGEAARRAIALACINFVYFMRAKTEERHLSRDPTYVEYALWMNDHGMFSFVGRWFPILRYKAPAGYVPEAERASATESDAGADGEGSGPRSVPAAKVASGGG
jgi:protein-S-isoprenylcysteine O-methyltransferase Ste14